MSLLSIGLFDSRYIITKLIGKGGSAEIYLANDTYTNKSVCLKVLSNSLTQKEEAVSRFENEARFTSMFDYSHIIKILNFGTYKEYKYISYELLQGKTVKELLDARGHLSKNETLDYMLQVLQAVEHIHNRGVIHNDIKPENLFYLYDGNIKLLDFGIATHKNDGKFTNLLASIYYVDPDVLLHKRYTVQSDIYALGTLLFEFLTGKTPFHKGSIEEEAKAHINEEVPSISKFVNLNDSASFDYVIKKATDKNLSERYQNVSDMIKDLSLIKEGKAIKNKNNLFKRIFKWKA